MNLCEMDYKTLLYYYIVVVDMKKLLCVYFTKKYQSIIPASHVKESQSKWS